jgi:hypothetical protein
MIEPAAVEWTPWLVFDEVAIPMAIHTDQTLDELGDTLLRLQHLRLLQFGQDTEGALLFRVRADERSRITALLDDVAQRRRD